MKLVVVESPNKKKTIQKYLGDEFEVHATAGHFRDLPLRELGIDLTTFHPTYVVNDEKASLLAGIRKAAKAATEVYLASDADREGEAIAWHLVDELGLKGAKRIRFHEITPAALKAALAASSSVDLHLVDAQQARRIIDRLVGYQLSPLLSPFGKNHSAGRVQSATLHLVVARELAREAHVVTPYWLLSAKYANNLTAKYVPPKADGDEEARILSEEEAAAIVARAAGPHTVSAVDTSPGEQRPKPPFITSTLQRAASKALKLKPDATMALAQQLFEAGAISYHRTDSVAVSDDAAAMARAYLEQHFPAAVPADRPVFKTKATAQAAHECIRPTALEPAVPDGLSTDALKLYGLIRARFLASQASPAKTSRTVIHITSGDTTWRASGTTIVSPGFLALDAAVDEDVVDDREGEPVLPAVAQGDVLQLVAIDSKQHETKPPSRYTHGSLVEAMEKHGIGRPATFANAVATLFAREYLAEDKQNVFPTPRGRLIDSLLAAAFPALVAADYTANLEAVLDDVADGKRSWRAELGSWYRAWESDLKAAAPVFGAEAAKRPELAPDAPKPTGKKCPLCTKELMLRTGKSGPFLSCSGYPDCKYAADPSAKPSEHKCPKCAGVMDAVEGKYGPYARCASPDCRATVDLRPVKVFKDKCPKCGGEMHERDGQHGPYARCVVATCKHIVDLKPPPDEPCPVCNGAMRDFGEFLRCATEACKGKWDKKALAAAKKNNRKCPTCNTRLLVTKKGPKGTFLGCSGYPVCNYIEDAKEGRAVKPSAKKTAAGGRR